MHFCVQGSSAHGPGSQAFDRHHSSGVFLPSTDPRQACSRHSSLREGCKRHRLLQVPSLYADPKVDSETWAAHAVVEVNTSVAKTGNHVCRAEVCHKGRIGLP